VRASVNMRIGTIKGMEYVAELFDSYHVQRNLIATLNGSGRCGSGRMPHRQKLYLLANVRLPDPLFGARPFTTTLWPMSPKFQKPPTLQAGCRTSAGTF